MAYGYGYGGYPASTGYYAPPAPMPDNLAQLRQAQFQQPMMGAQPTMQPTSPVQAPMQVPVMQPALQTQQQPISGPYYVSGEAGARGYLVAPNSSVMLIDADTDANTFWIKSADAAGMPSIRTFDYTERLNATKSPALTTNAQPSNQNSQPIEYVTREDFDNLAKMYEALKTRAEELGTELAALKSTKENRVKKQVTKEDSEQ